MKVKTKRTYGVYTPDTEFSKIHLKELRAMIERHCKENCLSQLEFATECGITQSTVSNFYRTGSCSLAVYFKLVEGLGKVIHFTDK